MGSEIDSKLLDDVVGEIPNLKEEVGGSILSCEIFCLLDKKTCQVVNYISLVFWSWQVGLLSQKELRKKLR